jgi:hypothetical protein
MKVVETIIKEIKVKDVLTGYTLTQKPIHDLVQVCGLSAAAYPNANSGLVRDRRDPQSSGHSGLKANFLEIQDDRFYGFYHISSHWL